VSIFLKEGIHLTTVKHVSQRGLVAVAIMLALILAFYSLANAATAPDRIVRCDENIANVINSDDKAKATRFVLGPCTYTVSQEMRLFDGDEIVGVPGSRGMRPVRGTYPVGIKSTLQAAPGVAVIVRPQGHFYTEWVRYTGADFKRSSATGVGIAGGSMADTSQVKLSLFDLNEGAGVSNARGTFIDVEAAFNGSSASETFIGGGIKATNQIHVAGGYYHDNVGNGVWCDVGCDRTSSPNGFWVHGADLSGNTGGGVRYENAETNALIEDNHVWGNATSKNRGGVSVRDAQNAVIRNNIFAGVGYKHNQEPDNVAIYASDSGKSTRPNLKNIEIYPNTLNRERIKSCGGPVICY
jgi:hypothetical protein